MGLIVEDNGIFIQAFGLGALEEDEAEDDVYGVESMTSYDQTLAGERDISMEQKYGWTGSHGTGRHIVLEASSVPKH